MYVCVCVCVCESQFIWDPYVDVSYAYNQC
jgi:hypothetical protein